MIRSGRPSGRGGEMTGIAGRLSGRRALVTGANRGIGRAVALRLAGEGAHVAVGARDEADAARLAEEIVRAGGSAVPVRLDVTDAASVATGVERAARPDRRIDLLVNNAGLTRPSPLDGDERSDEAFAEVLEVNLVGTWRVCRAALPFLAPGGRVVNFSSVTGRFGVAGMSGYCAAKTGMIGFTRALALELSPRRITVNALCPGWVDTDTGREGIRRIARQQGIGEEEAFALCGRMAPLGEVLVPEEVAGLVAYLASEEARNVTGQAIVIDGGQVMP
ncbi:SDR family oxidoreductase [Acidobacteria bacterium ACD]|nr:SDR family oxidoreductase [Acidobacteria bacterium ACB2]MDL1948456.1 SDR family oxidoreductase [Acidobacteria bacterium ACD]